MATSYTSLLGLALPVTGELSGTWGDTVNNYISNYIDAAVAGAQTVTADTTLTKTTGASLSGTSSQYAIIIASPASANITITAPAASKIYTIINTSATYTVKIVGAGPTTGVTLGVSEKAQVAWNGSDFVRIGASGGPGVFSSITNTGLTSGRVVYSTTGGLETDSANLLFNGTTLTANTLNLTNALGTTYGGTGLTSFTANGVVYASSSSALTTGSALTFNGSTLTTFNANATFSSGSSSTAGVTTSGAAGTQGVIQFGSSQTTYNIQGGPDYVGNVYNVASGASHQWAIAASEQMRLTSTGLGIGTSSPGYKLDVLGQIRQQQNSAAGFTTQTLENQASNGYAQFLFNVGANGANGQAQIGYAPGNFFAIGPVANDTTTSIVFRNNNATERARIDSSGNLGLGVTPSAWGTSGTVIKALQLGSGYSFIAGGNGFVDGYFGSNAYFNGTNWIYSSTSGAAYYNPGPGYHKWYTAPSGTAGTTATFTQAMTLDASGNLGLGTTTIDTGRNLTISGDGTTAATAPYLTISSRNVTGSNGTVFTAGGILFASYRDVYNPAYTAGITLEVTNVANVTTTPNAILFRVGGLYGGSGGGNFASDGSAAIPPELMRLTSGGNLGIGTTSPNARLAIANSGTGNLALVTFTSGNGLSATIASPAGSGSYLAGASAGDFVLRTETNSLCLGTQSKIIFGTPATEYARFDSSGRLGIGTASPGAQLTILGGGGSGWVYGYRNSLQLKNVNSSSNQSSVIVFGSNANDAYCSILNDINADGTTVNQLNIQAGGSGGVYLASGGTSWTSASDERVKDIFEPITDAVAKVLTLRTVIGKFKTDEADKRRAFLIAQDVQAVLPEAVTVGTDEINTLGLSYSDTIPLLVAAIKEQQTTIQSLTDRITQLEAK
jgi:hypothetical protein